MTDSGAEIRPNFGPLQLLRRVSIGGMAEVFKARRAEGDGARVLAVKRLLPSLADDPDVLRSFRAEADLGRQLDHPGLVRGFGFALIHGSPCSLWEYVDGRDLAALQTALAVTGAACAPVEVATIGVALAEALAYAHDATDADGRPLGLVHRDVSPHNLMLGRAGLLKLIDFGIAWRHADGAGRAGVLEGKRAYMSPEQVRGEALDARSDLFALGTVLWELATGARLFKADTPAETLANVAAAAVPPLSERAPQLPKGLADAIQACLASGRGDRPPSASALGRRLSPHAAPAEQASQVLTALYRRAFGDAPEPDDAASELDAYRADLRAAELGRDPAVDGADRTDITLLAR